MVNVVSDIPIELAYGIDSPPYSRYVNHSFRFAIKTEDNTQPHESGMDSRPDCE
jgi:hypothetical protein